MSKNMGYLKRKSHAISLAWLKEQVSEYLVKISTLVNGADVLTKPLPAESFWRHAVLSLNEAPLGGVGVSGESGFRRCECYCRNVTGHSCGQRARCLSILEPGDGSRCKHCANCGDEGTGGMEEGCGCPCRGHDVESHSFVPEMVSRIKLAVRRRSRKHDYPPPQPEKKGITHQITEGERDHGGKTPAAGGGHNAGTGNGCNPSKRRAVSDQEVVEIRQDLRSGTIANRLLRLVRSGFVRAVLLRWRDSCACGRFPRGFRISEWTFRSSSQKKLRRLYAC